MMIYVFHLLIFVFVLLVYFFYRLSRKYFTMFYWANVWDNTIKLETIVREITTKACIISIIAHKDSKLTDKEKEDDIIEKAASICADVLLQHKIEPRDYDLQSLVQVEIFRINTSIKK